MIITKVSMCKSRSCRGCSHKFLGKFKKPQKKERRKQKQEVKPNIDMKPNVDKKLTLDDIKSMFPNLHTKDALDKWASISRSN